MQTKVSDFIVSYIEKIGIKDVFLISGGGMMHLLNSLGMNHNIRKICNLNEQATTICSEGYALYNNFLGVAFVTTGPGGTNAVTGVASAYIDSTPLLVISGQVKTADLKEDKNVRQIGPQECDIISIVSPTTKYAVTVKKADEIKYHLQKAVYLATHGRRGPVWLDIPLDIQSAMIDTENIPSFLPEKEFGIQGKQGFSANDIEEIYEMLSQAKRPVILGGHGIYAANCQNEFLQLVEKLGIPFLRTWRIKDIVPRDYPLCFDSPGVLAPRYSNFIIQNCDFLLVIGARLNYCLTAYNESNFSKNAKKVIVDIDQNELNLLSAHYEKKICADAALFVRKMLQSKESDDMPANREWIAYCIKMRKQFPLLQEKQPVASDKIDGYKLAAILTQHLSEEDVIVSASSGRASAIAPMSFDVKYKSTRFIYPTGLGSMGYTLPISIGTSIASGKRVISIEGDGSLQHNLQELQVLNAHRLPIKLFVLNNNGYASIMTMQKNHFSSNFCACTPESGVILPEICKIAMLYDLDYYYIQTEEDASEILPLIFKDNRPVLCEVNIDSSFDEIPRAATKLDENGKPYSAPLDDLFPFLPSELRNACRFNCKY